MLDEIVTKNDTDTKGQGQGGLSWASMVGTDEDVTQAVGGSCGLVNTQLRRRSANAAGREAQALALSLQSTLICWTDVGPTNDGTTLASQVLPQGPTSMPILEEVEGKGRPAR